MPTYSGGLTGSFTRDIIKSVGKPRQAVNFNVTKTIICKQVESDKLNDQNNESLSDNCNAKDSLYLKNVETNCDTSIAQLITEKVNNTSKDNPKILFTVNKHDIPVKYRILKNNTKANGSTGETINTKIYHCAVKLTDGDCITVIGSEYDTKIQLPDCDQMHKNNINRMAASNLANSDNKYKPSTLQIVGVKILKFFSKIVHVDLKEPNQDDIDSPNKQKIDRELPDKKNSRVEFLKTIGYFFKIDVKVKCINNSERLETSLFQDETSQTQSWLYDISSAEATPQSTPARPRKEDDITVATPTKMLTPKQLNFNQEG